MPKGKGKRTNNTRPPYRAALERTSGKGGVRNPQKLIHEYRRLRDHGSPVQRYIFLKEALKGELPFRMRNLFEKELILAKTLSDAHIDQAVARLRKGESPWSSRE